MSEGHGIKKRRRPWTVEMVFELPAGVSATTPPPADPIRKKRVRRRSMWMIIVVWSTITTVMGESVDFILDYNGGLSKSDRAGVGIRAIDRFPRRRAESIHTQRVGKRNSRNDIKQSPQGEERGQMSGNGIKGPGILEIDRSFLYQGREPRRDRVISPHTLPYILPSQLQPASSPWFPVNPPSPRAFSEDIPPAFSEDQPISAPSADLPPAFSRDQPTFSPTTITNLPTNTANPTTPLASASPEPSLGTDTTASPSIESNTSMPSLFASPPPIGSPPPVDSPPPIASVPTTKPSNGTESAEPTDVPDGTNDSNSPTEIPTSLSSEPPAANPPNITTELPSSSPSMDPTAPTISPAPTSDPSSKPTSMPTISPAPTRQPLNLSSAPTTPAPTTNCPPVPPDPPGDFPACEVCGSGKCISDPDAETIFPGVSCGMFEMNGLAGNINPGVCGSATRFSSPCGCGFSGIPTILPAPTDTPEMTISPSDSLSISPASSSPTESPRPTAQTRNPAEPVIPTKTPTISPAPTITPSPTDSPVGEPVLETPAPTSSTSPTLSQEPTAPTTSPAPSPGAAVTPEPLIPTDNTVNATLNNKQLKDNDKTNDGDSSLGAVLLIAIATMILLTFGVKKVIRFRRQNMINPNAYTIDLDDHQEEEEEEEVMIVFEPEQDRRPLFGVDHSYYENDDEAVFESHLTSGQLLSLNDV